MYNRLSVKRYTPDFYKLCFWKRPTHTPFLNAKEEVVEPESTTPDCRPFEKPRTSFSRAKSMVYELAACNSWQCMVTITINPDLHDSSDLNAIMEKFAMWFRNQRRKPGMEDIKYLLVPELHDKHNAWHLHGFFLGLPEGVLVPYDYDPTCLSFDISKEHSVDEWDWYKFNKKRYHMNEDGYLNWPALEERFGWFSAKMHDGQYMYSAAYICKYITKEFGDSVFEKNASLYYPCQGLKRSERCFYGTVISEHLFSKDIEEVRKRIFAFSNQYICCGCTTKVSVDIQEDQAVLSFFDPLGNDLNVFVSGYTDFCFDAEHDLSS